mmetsp:Transcript_83592/g.237177  ORF Transcript_83592/g.237177 Transcript_83592/m.237177 type:complete len:417 (+) Transcript_83592:256-1506(+)
MSPVTRLTVPPVTRLTEKWFREFPAKCAARDYYHPTRCSSKKIRDPATPVGRQDLAGGPGRCSQLRGREVVAHCPGHELGCHALQLGLECRRQVLVHVDGLHLVRRPDPRLIQAAVRRRQDAVAREGDVEAVLDARVAVAALAAVCRHGVDRHVRLHRARADVRDGEARVEDPDLLHAQRVEPAHQRVLRAAVERAHRGAELACEAADVYDVAAPALPPVGHQRLGERDIAQEVDAHHLHLALHPRGVAGNRAGAVAAVVHEHVDRAEERERLLRLLLERVQIVEVEREDADVSFFRGGEALFQLRCEAIKGRLLPRRQDQLGALPRELHRELLPDPRRRPRDPHHFAGECVRRQHGRRRGGVAAALLQPPQLHDAEHGAAEGGGADAAEQPVEARDDQHRWRGGRAARAEASARA